MEKIKQILKKKPFLFVFISLLYALGVAFLRWGIHPVWNVFWFLTGSLLGIYFLDISEDLFAISPSPFRTIVFLGAFILVSFFIVTSSGNAFAVGLVLLMFLDLILWQIGELGATGNLNQWYAMMKTSVSGKLQKWGLAIGIVMFLFETAIFLRSA